MRNRFMFEKMATGMALAAAVMAGAAMLSGSGHGLVVKAYAADVSNQNAFGIDTGVDKTDKTGGEESTASNNDDSGVYDFTDNKASGTVTITKKWDDGLTNAEREIPDMSISTEKPSKSTKGYTVTFHGNGLKFADGTDENMVVYNSSGQIVEGSYKEAVGTGVVWYTNEACTQKAEISDDGVPQVELTGDLDLWAKELTFEIKGTSDLATYHNDFNASIPDTVTKIVFTDEIKPKTANEIDVDADGDGGVVAWLDDNSGTVMKISTQIQGVKVKAAKASGYMFFYRNKLKDIDFTMLDTSEVVYTEAMFMNCTGLTNIDMTCLNFKNVRNITGMFANCSNIQTLDLSPFCNSSKINSICGDCRMYNGHLSSTQGLFSGCRKLRMINLSSLNLENVVDMEMMFSNCTSLTNIDLSTLNTSKATNMRAMFMNCSGLTELDLTPLNTSNVTNMSKMFWGCSGLKSLELTPLDTSKVKRLDYIFSGCRKLTSLDLTPLNTQNVTNMHQMFSDCSGLTVLDLTPLNTSNVTDMSGMFKGCTGLTNLDLTPLNTSNVTNMYEMFSGCSGLASLDLAPLNTQKATHMGELFSYCSKLTSLDLTPLNTSNVMYMNGMFKGCTGLTNLDLTPLNTSNVTNMYEMFSGCSGLASLDLTPLNTQSVTDISYMFSMCSGLTTLDLTPLSTQKVKYMMYAFYGCSKLTNINLASLNTENVTNMDSMFGNCSSLTSLTTGATFKFAGTNYNLPGTWQNTAGETFTSGTFPSNVADTYTRIS